MLGAYRWLSENHQKGDRIYLFGVYHRSKPEPAVLTPIPRLFSGRLPGQSTLSNDRQSEFTISLTVDNDLIESWQVGLIRRGNEEQISLYVALKLTNDLICAQSSVQRFSVVCRTF